MPLKKKSLLFLQQIKITCNELVMSTIDILISPRGCITVEIAYAPVPNKRGVLVVGDREFSENLINQGTGRVQISSGEIGKSVFKDKA